MKTSLDPQILYEEEGFVVISKPSGLLVHGSKVWTFEAGAALTDWLLERYPSIKEVGDSPERPGIVHRLDKETSGVMVVAKTQEAFLYLKSLFKTKDIQKTYLALVHGVLKNKSGIIDKPISIVDGSVRRTVRDGKMAREATTEYEVQKQFENFALVKVMPKTGRTHQIRVHMASLGHPLVGDRMYGRKKDLPGADRLMLHALSLSFTAPDGQRLHLESEPDAHFLEVVAVAATA